MRTKTAFRMPRAVTITGRSSTITNSFVNGIIPVIPPSEAEIEAALKILGMSAADVQCSYCGDKATEWEHLRPIVKNKRPTGYISEIANLVPACGKCNQSKSGTPWREWIEGAALQSPRVRGVSDLLLRIERLEAYEAWRQPTVVDWEAIIAPDLWKAHWENLERMHEFMRECQKVSDRVKAAAKSAAVAQPVLEVDRQNAGHSVVG